MSSIVDIKNVHKVYQLGDNTVEALKNVNISINKGDFLAITGSSGSGKSTLMHVIGLLDQPTSGKVYLNNKDVSTLDENHLAQLRNKYIGFVFQNFNLLKRTSAVENVELPLIYSGVERSERRERARKVLTRVGLGDRLDHHSNQLSGGQQQRVALARALINDPDLILADEPTGNLDSKSGEEIMKLLKELNSKGNTIVLVTHELDIAKGTKRIVTLKDGEIISDIRNGKHK